MIKAIRDARTARIHPAVACDVYEKEIRNAEMGMVFVHEDGSLTFAHKNTCDKDQAGDWLELGGFLDDLFHNAGAARGHADRELIREEIGGL